MNLHLIISGRVQGVGYRQWFCARARAAGVAGWVRNRADGTVEAVVSGPSDIIETLAADAFDGPPGAGVQDIDRSEVDGSLVGAPGRGFVIAPSV
ncbi:acylphosphatase [Bosea sp. 2RAB26]|uniref:acylphosphatase n=1 Tax=Bosea sp. 2RAB26 TaxID=3237476 RepID=UPI003F923236